MSRWLLRTTADLIQDRVLEIGDGYRAKNAEFAPNGGLPFVRVGDVRTSICLDGIDELPIGKRAKYEPKVSRPGDSLITMKGTVGRVAYVPSGSAPFVYSPQISYWRSHDRQVIHPRWLRYWLEGPEFAWQALATKGATDMADYINLRDQRRMQISLPPLKVQEGVARVLGGIDDLIENNRRRVELLEEMAQAIYREWFVHFRYPGHANVPLVDSAIGPAPDGWRVKPLFEVADVGFGVSFKSKRFSREGPSPVVRIRDVPVGTTKTFSDEVPAERYRIVDGDILIGMDGEFYLRQWSGGEAWLNQRVARLRPTNGMAARHLMLAIAGQIQEWNAAITGTTVAHLGKSHLEQVQVLSPPNGILVAATSLFDDIAEQTRAILQASRALTSIRDLLLPRLVTGQIDAPNLGNEAPAEAATA